MGEMNDRLDQFLRDCGLEPSERQFTEAEWREMGYRLQDAQEEDSRKWAFVRSASSVAAQHEVLD